MNLSYIIIGIFLVVFVVMIILFILKRMKGSLDIIPEKYNYSAGEEVKGKVILKLKKSVNSKKLMLTLKCVKFEKRSSGKKQYTENYTLFEFNQELEGKKQYLPSEYSYNFSIKIPKNASRSIEGVAGTIFRPAQILLGGNSSFKWYLASELECEGVDLSKEIQISVE